MSGARFNLLGPRPPGEPAPVVDAPNRSLLPEPLPALLWLVFWTGCLVLLVKALPLILLAGALAFEWVLG